MGRSSPHKTEQLQGMRGDLGGVLGLERKLWGEQGGGRLASCG